MKKRTSIHDIARHLNMSSATVSIVLSGKAREKNISVETEKRILDYTREIDYQPNLTAKSLRTGKSNLIAMLVESIDDPFFSSVAKGVEVAAYDHGYKVFFASTENQTGKAKALLNVFKERQVDGYIIAPPPGIEMEIQDLQEAGKSVVIFDRYISNGDSNTVMINNYQGSYEAVQHLQTNGYQQIGFVTLDSSQSQMTERSLAYKDALAKAGTAQYITVVPYNLPQEQTVKHIRSWLQRYPQLDAVYFSTNYLTLAGLEAIKSLKLKIPKDLGVISFDDSPYFKLHHPSITVIAQPIEAIAQQVTKMLMDRMVDKKESTESELSFSKVTLSTNIIVRESTAPKVSKAKNKGLNHI